MGVHLSKIYTRSGDAGTTGLGDGSRVSKTSLRVEAYGTVDEVGAVLGLARGAAGEGEFADLILELQNDLFDVGSDLCVPGEAGEKLRIPAAYVERLEGHIDRLNADLEPLNSFVLAGGTPLASWLHMGRTVSRRAERIVVALIENEDECGPVNPEVARYLNRLSDLLFVMSRKANQATGGDVLWKPGGNA